MGEQPLSVLMAGLGLRNHDLAEASGEQLTHKMVARARRGRRLTPHVQDKVIRALEKAAGKSFPRGEIFNY